MIKRPSALFPPLEWARGYHKSIFASDMLAAVIVTIMLIPQSLAYALLAEMLGMHFILGAFQAGLFFNRRTIDKTTYEKIQNKT